MKNLFNKIDWKLINQFGRLRFSKSSYIYVILIPILVKFLEKIENPLLIKHGENIIPLNLELPFSWYLFYFGALLIAIASLLYQIYCPKIIKDYKNYGEFLNSGESDDYINDVRDKIDGSILKRGIFNAPYIEEKTIEREKSPVKIPDTINQYIDTEKITGYKHNIKYQEERKNLFNELFHEMKFWKSQILITSFILYLLGFLTFTIVIIQNIVYVIKHLIY